MPLFEYTGFDRTGRKVSGSTEAPGKNAVLQKLRSQGVFPTAVKEEREPKGLRLKWRNPLRRKVSPLRLSAATRQLAILLTAGLPLDEALAALGEQSDQPVLAKAIQHARQEVIAGEPLHRALHEQRIFPELYISMVEVGENSGNLDKVLSRLADFLEEQAHLRSRIQSALAYPMLMMAVGIAVLAVLFVYVIPEVTRMLEELGQALPLPTRILIGTGDFVAGHVPHLLIGAVLLAIGLSRLGRSARGKKTLDRLALGLPVVGKLNRFITTSRFTRTLATLLQGGVPLLTALEIVTRLFRNQLVTSVLEQTAVSIREGKGLAAPLKAASVFPPLVAQMAAVGERSGDLEGVLFKVAEAHEQEIRLTLATLLSLLEPMLILVMAAVVGFVVMAILVPLFQAGQGIL